MDSEGERACTEGSSTSFTYHVYKWNACQTVPSLCGECFGRAATASVNGRSHKMQESNLCQYHGLIATSG